MVSLLTPNNMGGGLFTPWLFKSRPLIDTHTRTSFDKLVTQLSRQHIHTHMNKLEIPGQRFVYASS